MRSKLMERFKKTNGEAPYKLTTTARFGWRSDAVSFMEDLKKMHPEAIVKLFEDSTERWTYVVYMWEKRES